MATVKDIYKFIDSFAPFVTQEDWDNSGLLVGDENATVNKILFALDATEDVLNQALKIGADLIITHHPVIFHPLSAVTQNTLAYKLIKNNIALISAHTNYDKAVDGVNDILCKTVGFDSFEKVDGVCLNIGIFDKKMILDDFISKIKNSLNCKIRYNKSNRPIKRVLVCGGAGSDFLNHINEFECDALLTGDGSHHSFLDASEMGISLICAGHFETEMIAVEPLKNKIENKFNIECASATQYSPIITV